MSLLLGPGEYMSETLDRRVVAGLTLTRTLHRQPTRLPLHTHEAPYFCLVVDGAFDESAGAIVREARPGTLLFHPAGESHSDEIRTETRLFNIGLRGSWIRRLEELEPFLRPSPGRQGAAAARVARRVAGEMSAPDRTSMLAIEGLVLTLLVASARSPGSQGSRPPGWLPVAVDFIRASFRGAFDHEALARVAGVHPTHLAREFRRHTGRTVTGYVHRLRIQWACQRLARADATATLVQLALDAGFADHAHFTRVFRREAGMTPSEYRRRFRPERA